MKLEGLGISIVGADEATNIPEKIRGGYNLIMIRIHEQFCQNKALIPS
jgi:hypothetical protein